jgi:hypothetical protein
VASARAEEEEEEEEGDGDDESEGARIFGVNGMKVSVLSRRGVPASVLLRMRRKAGAEVRWFGVWP